jgi:hypothetical protein
MAGTYADYVARKNAEGKPPVSEEEWEKRWGSKSKAAEPEEKAVEPVVETKPVEPEPVKAPAPVVESKPEAKEEPKAEPKKASKKESAVKPTGLTMVGGPVTADEERALKRLVPAVNLMRRAAKDKDIAAGLKTASVTISQIYRGETVEVDNVLVNCRNAAIHLRKAPVDLDGVDAVLAYVDDALDQLEQSVRARI